MNNPALQAEEETFEIIKIILLEYERSGNAEISLGWNDYVRANDYIENILQKLEQRMKVIEITYLPDNPVRECIELFILDVQKLQKLYVKYMEQLTSPYTIKYSKRIGELCWLTEEELVLGQTSLASEECRLIISELWGEKEKLDFAICENRWQTTARKKESLAETLNLSNKRIDTAVASIQRRWKNTPLSIVSKGSKLTIIKQDPAENS